MKSVVPSRGTKTGSEQRKVEDVDVVPWYQKIFDFRVHGDDKKREQYNHKNNSKLNAITLNTHTHTYTRRPTIKVETWSSVVLFLIIQIPPHHQVREKL